LQKVGKPFRLDNSKWDLTDKAFKELDIWDFHYPNEGDRQLAINRAISAFDRMRLSTSEKLWDMLIPKDERGKGKILSHLNHLHKGPIQQATTPKIQIQHPSNDAKENTMRDNDSDQKDRLAPGDAEPMARSRSHGQIKKTKVSEKEAQSKRLLSNGSKKATPAPKVKQTHPAVKKGGVKKANAPKSSEFVNDSDEEDGLGDAQTLQAQSSPPKNEKKSKPPKPVMSSQPARATTKPKASKPIVPSQSFASNLIGKKVSSKPATPNRAGATPKSRPTNVVNGKDTQAKEVKNADKAPTLPTKVQEKRAAPPATSTTSSPAPKHRMSDSSQGSTAMKKTLSRQRTTSSPHKPSPLGSSPPTNASDFDNPTQSSTSSTPSIPKMNPTPNGIVNGHARNTSEHTLKRKAYDLDSDIHNHNIPMTNSNSNINGYANGNTNSAKRPKATEMTPPTSESDSSPIARDIALKKAQDFKKYYANYEKQYREIDGTDNPSKEAVEALMKMHNRLAELKDQITKGLVGI
jgi:RNA polymerase II elongation factor ELL